MQRSCVQPLGRISDCMVPSRRHDPAQECDGTSLECTFHNWSDQKGLVRANKTSCGPVLSLRWPCLIWSACSRIWSETCLHYNLVERLCGNKLSATSNLLCDHCYLPKRTEEFERPNWRMSFCKKKKKMIIWLVLCTYHFSIHPASPPCKEPTRCPGLRKMPWRFQRSISAYSPCLRDV